MMIPKIMVFQKMDEEQRKLMAVDLTQLEVKKKMKNEGAGLLIFGIPILILGVVNQLVPIDLLFDYNSDIIKLLVSAALILAGVACCVFGVKCMGKTGDSLAEIIRSDNKDFYTFEDIYDYEREVRDNKDVLIFLSGKEKVKAENVMLAGLLTENWLRVPGQRANAIIARIPDIVAAWHEKDGIKDGFVGLYILRSDGMLYAMDSRPEFSEKVMEAIRERNPLTILAGRFIYEGKNYDVCANKEQVIEIYKRNLAERNVALK